MPEPPACDESLATRVAAARRWIRLLGHSPTERHGIMVVSTPAHPLVFEANFMMAKSGAEFATPGATLGESAGGNGCHMAYVDCLTRPSMIEAFERCGLRPGSTLTEMSATAICLTRQLPSVSARLVDKRLWPTLIALIEANFYEGKQVRDSDRDVVKGLVEIARRRAIGCKYWLIELDGDIAGYGMTAVCPNRLGLIEDLFTKPNARGLGVMSAFIRAAWRHLEAAGCDAVFLDALHSGRPAQLYRSLGFHPVTTSILLIRASS